MTSDKDSLDKLLELLKGNVEQIEAEKINQHFADIDTKIISASSWRKL